MQGRQSEQKATVFKATGQQYQLKMRASRAFLSDVTKRFGILPFTLRYTTPPCLLLTYSSCDDEKKARMAVTECAKHGVLQAYEPVLERDDAVVVQCKVEVLLTENGTQRVTAGTLPIEAVKSEKKITNEELLKLLSTSVSGKSKKKKPAKKVGVFSLLSLHAHCVQFIFLVFFLVFDVLFFLFLMLHIFVNVFRRARRLRRKPSKDAFLVTEFLLTLKIK